MIVTLQKTKIFSVPFFFFVAALSVLLLFYTKATVALSVNSWNSTFLDECFKLITYLGDGLILMPFALIVLFLNIRKGTLLIAGYLISGLIIQGLKIFIFPEMPRPVALLGSTHHLHLVDGVKILMQNSFPSGHSASAFALFFAMAAFTERKSLQLAAFITACLVAFSRMYLMQHFLTDVIAGSVIGMLTTLVLLAKSEQSAFLTKLDHPLFIKIRKQDEKIS